MCLWERKKYIKNGIRCVPKIKHVWSSVAASLLNIVYLYFYDARLTTTEWWMIFVSRVGNLIFFLVFEGLSREGKKMTTTIISLYIWQGFLSRWCYEKLRTSIINFLCNLVTYGIPNKTCAIYFLIFFVLPGEQQWKEANYSVSSSAYYFTPVSDIQKPFIFTKSKRDPAQQDGKLVLIFFHFLLEIFRYFYAQVRFSILHASITTTTFST